MDEMPQDPGIVDKVIAALRGGVDSLMGGASSTSGVLEARTRYNVYRTNGGTLSFEDWVAQGEPAP